MTKDSRIFLAGHKGLVGAALLRRLQADGYTNLITRTRAELDLTDQAATAEFFRNQRPEFVLLAAAKVGGIHANDTFPAEFIYTNLAIQNNVLHQSYLNGGKRVLFLGSSCIYPRNAAQPIEEGQLLTGPLEPTNAAYAMAKISGIQMCWAYNRQYGTRFIPVMPTNLYGPGDNFDLTSSHVLPALIRKFHLAALAQAGRFDEISADEKRFGRIPDDIMSDLERIKACGAKEGVTLWGTGRPMREFLFVDDLADGCLLVLRTAFDTLCRHGGQPDEILFNIGTGEDQSIRDLAAVAADVVGYRGKVAWNHDMPDGTPRKCLNVGRMHALGWRAGTVLREGIEKTVRWYRSRT